jgi:DNA-binding MarR family transcriptional regulator
VPGASREVRAGTASDCLDNYCLDNYRAPVVDAKPADQGVEAHGDETVATLVFHAARDIRTALERQLSNHGITAQQATLARLLHAWKRKQKPSPFQIAARLGTDGAGMTRLIDRLEAKGVVVRHVGTGDRRLISIELTATGLAIAKRAAPTFSSFNQQLLEGFTDHEVEHLTDMLRRLGHNARSLSR